MSKTGATGLKRICNAFVYSCQGIRSAFINEAAFRQEIFLAIILIPIAFWVDVTLVERLLMVSSVALIMVVELLNSAVEAVVDRIGAEHHELAGRAKDMGSAAVLIMMLITGFIWISILFF
ncbi:diacylglycerol kinase [Vibrio marisflavi]|uniref:Diacylglycerol kinase n=1 Tax=Vibrio marisflavi CECT 7928 TaxID=634439 RepID=A0ABN8EBU5_9VIBR|nr:diacylglycerol kinase [Vibrio marisflavi]CAH0542687.1 Diacylglycerol kinase [Vibrio marisflavi CECT 7928]